MQIVVDPGTRCPPRSGRKERPGFHVDLGDNLTRDQRHWQRSERTGVARMRKIVAHNPAVAFRYLE